MREARAGLAQRTRVCSYDRVGIGWSDRAPSTVPVSMLSKDLGMLLDELSPRAPAVLVASSIGGVTVEFFARQHPERVAGLVFLDAGNSRGVARRVQQKLRYRRSQPLGCGVVRAAGAIALVRLCGIRWHLRRERIGIIGTLCRGDVRRQAVGHALCDGARGEATVSEFDDAPPLRREIPITALSAQHT